MNDERLGQEIRDFYRETDVTPPDSRESAREVASRLGQVEQMKRRRWLPPRLTRATHETSPIPATNGHTPTVIGRTSSMLSPVKAITAGALVFAIGGVMFIAQPFGQQRSVPGAEVDAGPAESVPFTVRFSWMEPSVRSPEVKIEDGVTKTIGECWAPGIVAPSDPRIDGTLTYCGSEHVYGEDTDASTLVWITTYRIVNDEGAWQGSGVGAAWDDPGSGERMDKGGDPIILVGEGAYDGLYAAMTFLPDWSDIRGVIFEGPPPAEVVPPTAD